MQTILDTVLPFFALILCGYGAGRLRVLDGAAIAGVNTFVFYFALPVFLFDLLAAAPASGLLNGPFVAAYLSAGLLVFALAAVAGRVLFGLGAGSWAVFGSAAVLGNTGYMGLPLVAAVLGGEAAIPLVVGLTLEVFVLIPLSIAIIEAGKQSAGANPASLALSVAGSLVRNPLIIAIAAGALVSTTGLPLPAPVLGFTDLLGGAAGPCALFALGATLASFPVSSNPREVSTITLFKLLVHPAAMYLATFLLFGVDPLWATVATVGASLPVAANVFIIARQYDAYLDRASNAVLVSTMASILTVPALLLVLTPA